MDTTYSTSTPPENPETFVNESLNLRIRYFRSIGGAMVLACFDTAPIEDNPFFIEIDEVEYRHLCKELNS